MTEMRNNILKEKKKHSVFTIGNWTLCKYRSGVWLGGSICSRGKDELFDRSFSEKKNKRFCRRDSLWQTSNAWPIVRTIWIASFYEKITFRSLVFFHVLFYFFVSFENITTKCIARIVTSDETEDLKILTIVWNVENTRKYAEKSKDKVNLKWLSYR